MTPGELETLRKMIASTVKTEVGALETRLGETITDVWEAIRKLQTVDERTDKRLGTHSGTHKDLATNVRKSLEAVVEIKTATLESVDAKLDAFRTEMRAERDELVKAPAAAEGAKTAAIQASAAAQTVQIDTAQIRKNQDDRNTQDRLRFWVTLIPILAAAIATIVRALQGTQ